MSSPPFLLPPTLTPSAPNDGSLQPFQSTHGQHFCRYPALGLPGDWGRVRGCVQEDGQSPRSRVELAPVLPRSLRAHSPRPSLLSLRLSRFPMLSGDPRLNLPRIKGALAREASRLVLAPAPLLSPSSGRPGRSPPPLRPCSLRAQRRRTHRPLRQTHGRPPRAQSNDPLRPFRPHLRT